MGLSCHDTTPRSLFEDKPQHHKPSLDWRAYSEHSQLKVKKRKGSQGSQSWGLNREKPTKREKARKTVDVQPLTLQKKTVNFFQQEHNDSSRSPPWHRITSPWGPSSAQEYQRQCTASDMRHVGQEDKTKMLGSWTSEVRNTERYLRAAKPGIRLGTRAEEGQEDWSALWIGLNSNIHLFSKPFYFLLMMGCNYMPKLMS